MSGELLHYTTVPPGMELKVVTCASCNGRGMFESVMGAEYSVRCLQCCGDGLVTMLVAKPKEESTWR